MLGELAGKGGSQILGRGGRTGMGRREGEVAAAPARTLTCRLERPHSSLPPKSGPVHVSQWENGTLVLSAFHLVPIGCWLKFKVLVFIYKSLTCLDHVNLADQNSLYLVSKDYLFCLFVKFITYFLLLSEQAQSGVQRDKITIQTT